MANPLSQFSASKFKPIRYVPSGREEAILAFQVQNIIAAGHIIDESADTNHWCFYLQHSQDKSVRIDCQPSHSEPGTHIKGGSKAFVIISEFDSLLSADAIKHVKLDVRPGVTVADVLNLLRSNGRHKYEFDERGRGCRMWTTDQINLFEQEKLAENSSQCENARESILTLWPGQTPHTLDAGKYYQ